MASDHQMAVARTGRSLPPAPLSKSTRQIVPAFLQKLYEMVNDPKNSDLIRWSDAGDSFFVLDHERFAHDVLGRWFKHRNFSSFVRQLNMYGFHKIPHLQQGVLKSDNETEFWNFAHANFHRGQPDLLCLIQRKKTANQSAADDMAFDIRDSNQPQGSNPSGMTSAMPGNQGPVLDVQAIVSGIAAIKRHQTTISAELNELKRSNQLLWQDAMAARTRHQKQQDTVNKIVKFLAGVFGHHGTHGKDDTVQTNPPHVVIPRRGPRFMIEDAKRDGKSIIEMDDMDILSSVETPMSMIQPSSAPSESAPSEKSSHSSQPTSTPPLQQPEPHHPQTHQPESSAVEVRSVTPGRLNPSPIYDFDHRLQGVLNQLSPSQIQHLVNSLASQPNSDIAIAPAANVPAQTPANLNSHLTHYPAPPFEFSSLTNPPSNNVFAASLQLPTSSDGLISFNSYDSLPQEHVERNWQAAEDIDKDVNALNTSIHHLIQTFGLDPNMVDTPTSLNTGANVETPSTDMSASMPLDLNAIPAQDFDFDNFFNILPGAADGNIMDYTDGASTAFLDEVPSPVGSTASPIQTLRKLSPEVNNTAAAQMMGDAFPNAFPGNGRKRKSDVSELDGGLPQLQTTSISAPMQDDMVLSATAKSKKRKEK